MSTKAKKVKKPMSQQAKRNLANIFGSIISNQRAIDGAKEMPIWVALIFFLLSAFLPVIPTMVNTSKTYGASFVDSYNYNFDTTLAAATHDLKKDGHIFKVVDKNLTYTQPGQESPVQGEFQELLYTYTFEAKGIQQYALKVYYSNKDINALITECTKDIYKLGTTTKATEEDKEIYIPSFMILHEKHLYICLCKDNTATLASRTYDGSNWEHYGSDLDLLARVTSNVEDSWFESSDKLIEYRDKVFNVWKDVFNESFISQKDYNMLVGTFIYLGIFAALILFMGLMIFLLTRGKKNVFRYLSIITCLKIGAWASFTPALIGMILGFIFVNQSTLFFIMVLGLRIMWLCMKQLRPQQY